jgi:hypothetical protein
MFQLVLILFSFSAWSTTLVGRYQFLNASNLPKNLWLFGVSHSESKGTNSYSGNGSKVSNSDYFSRNLNYSHLLDEVNDPLEKELARAAFDSYGRKSNESAGRVINDVSVEQKADAYILGRGLSEKSGLFLIFPVVTLRTSFKSTFKPSESLTKLANQLKQEGQLAKAREILQKSQTALRERLDENGYNNTYPSELTTLANIYVNYRYQALRQQKFKVASDSFLVVPAGKKFSEDDFVPIRVNEEQFGVKQAFTGEWSPSHYAGLLSSLYYHKRFPFTKAQRVPNNQVSPLSPDVDNNTRVRYGDSWGTSLQANFVNSESLTLYVGQSLEYKLQDNYKGREFTSDRYSYLEQGTDQRLGTGYLGINVNTIPSFLAKNFLIPMDVNLQYSFSNTGKNTFQNRTIALNMMVFYQ